MPTPNPTQHKDNATQHNATQHDTTQRNTTQHNTTQHNTTQHNTTQHNTTTRLVVHFLQCCATILYIVELEQCCGARHGSVLKTRITTSPNTALACCTMMLCTTPKIPLRAQHTVHYIQLHNLCSVYHRTLDRMLWN